MMTSSLQTDIRHARQVRLDATHFLNLTSATRSWPPLMLSARNTLPVVAMATICECSLNGLNEIGS